MTIASKDMVESDIVQEEATFMDNNVEGTFTMVWVASTTVEEAFEMVDKIWEEASIVHKA